MLELDGLIGLIAIGLWVFCFIDVLLTPDGEQRNLPKLAWVFIVLLLPELGSICWLIWGKNYGRSSWGASSQPKSRATSQYPEYDRPGRYVPTNPDDDEEFLAGLRARAEEQRRRARDQSQQQSDQDHPDTEPDK